MSGNLNNILSLAAAGGATGNSLGRFAPLGTTMPAAPDAVLDAAFKDPGLCHTDAGLVKASSQNSSPLYAVGASYPVRVFKTQKVTTFAIVFLETNPITMGIYNELALDAIVPDGAGVFDFIEGPIRNQRYAGVFDLIDGVNLYRYACPVVEVTERQSVTMKNDQGKIYGVTFTCYPGSDGTAVHHMGKIPSLAP